MYDGWQNVRQRASNKNGITIVVTNLRQKMRQLNKHRYQQIMLKELIITYYSDINLTCIFEFHEIKPQNFTQWCNRLAQHLYHPLSLGDRIQRKNSSIHLKPTAVFITMFFFIVNSAFFIPIGVRQARIRNHDEKVCSLLSTLPWSIADKVKYSNRTISKTLMPNLTVRTMWTNNAETNIASKITITA